MKSSTAALLLASIGSLTSASPVKSRQTTEPSAFTIIAARSGSPIHLQTVQASDRAFWIGKETTTYCPPEVDAEGSCPPGTQTVFEGGESTLSLVSHIFPSCRTPRPCLFFHILVLRLASQERTTKPSTHFALFSRMSAFPAASESTSSPPEPWGSPRPIPLSPPRDPSSKASRSTRAHRLGRSASPDWEPRDSWPVLLARAALSRTRSSPTWRA